MLFIVDISISGVKYLFFELIFLGELFYIALTKNPFEKQGSLHYYEIGCNAIITLLYSACFEIERVLK